MTKNEFAKKVLEMEDVLFHISYGILKNVPDCEDVIQEAILKAYEGRTQLKNPQYFKTWLVRIVINESYSFIRKKKKDLAFCEAVINDETTSNVFIKEEYFELHESMKKLAEKERICVQLFYMEGYSVKEIAQIFHIPEGTVKSRLNRARKQLKNSLLGGSL